MSKPKNDLFDPDERNQSNRCSTGVTQLRTLVKDNLLKNQYNNEGGQIFSKTVKLSYTMSRCVNKCNS